MTKEPPTTLPPSDAANSACPTTVDCADAGTIMAPHSNTTVTAAANNERSLLIMVPLSPIPSRLISHDYEPARQRGACEMMHIQLCRLQEHTSSDRSLAPSEQWQPGFGGTTKGDDPRWIIPFRPFCLV